MIFLIFCVISSSIILIECILIKKCECAERKSSESLLLVSALVRESLEKVLFGLDQGDVQCVPIYSILIHFIKISKVKFSCYFVFISE